jgi:hypothetical protein
MPDTSDTKPSSLKGRPFVGIMFECCNVYQRIYLNKERTAFRGGCPKCGKRVEVLVDPNGEKERFFVAR